MLDKSAMYISIPFLIFEIFYKWIITILESLKIIEQGNLLLKIADFFFFFCLSHFTVAAGRVTLKKLFLCLESRLG